MSNGKIVSGRLRKKFQYILIFMKKLIIDHANEYDLDKRELKVLPFQIWLFCRRVILLREKYKVFYKRRVLFFT